MKKKLARAGMAAAMVLALATSSWASVITWDPVGTVDSSTEINNQGTTVLAYKLNDTGSSQTANGVTFGNSLTQNGVTLVITKVGAGTHYQNVSYFVDPIANYFSGPDATAYGEICRGLQDAQGDITLAFSGLTVNQQYLAQLWNVDFRQTGQSQAIALDGGTASGNMPFNSYVVGTFTADATTANFVISSSTNDRRINAIQLRAIPEPGSLTLLGLLGGALFLRRQLRKSR